MPRGITRWYIEPTDTHTKNALASAELLNESEALPVYKAEHGKCVRAVEVSLKLRDYILASAARESFKFRLWKSFDGGVLRHVLTDAPKQKLIAAVRKEVRNLRKRPLKADARKPQLVR